MLNKVDLKSTNKGLLKIFFFFWGSLTTLNLFRGLSSH